MVNKNYGINLKPGMSIAGKWNRRRYFIKRKLGSGTVGKVFLCETENKEHVALKISKQSTSLIVEVNVLKALDKVQGNYLGPYLIDIDDWETTNGTYTFYVMEYLHGETPIQFIRKNGSEWIGVFMIQLLEGLERLHKSGWVFGDLKTENLLIVSSPPRIRWVDVGGTTQIGRAIKEYTEFYDRGYWGLGTRKAEPSYDLFAFVMVFLSIYYPKQFSKTKNSKQTLFNKIDQLKPLKPYSFSLKKAINGEYHSSAEMKNELLTALNNRYQMKSLKQRRSYLDLLIETGGIIIVSITYYVISWLVF